ncbi:hypothetical protein PAPYR_10720 [Paratrimastix pyriformis]|uniref:Uncharacterized protein n=1 Tax=Paratrimastix pyriformis TaxID=342808 RepID=A0ABQ8UB02_9EUKA|nr:hypothetical protein PAPYR_10720 [Paratrimastix pyriformis]
MHIAEENHLSDFQVHFLKEHAQCGKREVFLEFFNRAEEDDLVFHDLDHISTFKNSMLDEFCKLFGHLGFSSGALPSSTLNYCPRLCGSAISSIETTLHHLILATLRHPQLTTLLTLQLRQNVFLRVPINVVGDRDVSIPGLTHHLIHRRRGATRLPVPATVYVCYTHARWYVGSKPPPFRPF